MTDDVIRSMKSQMIPSDDVVSDLLAKIAALEASPETMDNVVSFDESRFNRSSESAAEVTAKPAKKSKTKSIWYYGTAAAASAIVLLSAFSIFGSTDPGDVQDVFDDVVNNPGVVSTNIGATETVPPQGGDVLPVDGEKENDNEKENRTADAPGNKDSENTQNTENPADTGNQPAGNSDAQQGKSQQTAEGNPAGDSQNQQDSEKTPDKNTQKNPDSSVVTAPPPADNDQSGAQISTGDGKVTPGAPGTSAISWKREILAENSVSNITVSGTNYVVDTTSSKNVTSSEIKSISLDIPATSTTNEATVAAKVKTVKNVSPDLMVAVYAECFKEALLYQNKNYSPDTLGQFLEDAGLMTNTTFSKTVFYKGESIGLTSYQKKSFSGLDKLVAEYIFSCEKASTASYSSYTGGTDYVLFKSTDNPTCSVIDFGVSNNGYLYVKMSSGNTFTFHIGEQKASEFVNLVTGM